MSDQLVISGVIVLLIAATGLVITFHKRTIDACHRTLRRGCSTLRAGRLGFAVSLVLSLLGLSLGSGNTLLAAFLVLIATLIFALVCLCLLHIPTAEADRPSTVLVVAAHPDDLEIACGATVAKLVDTGHRVFGLIMTTGAAGGDSAVRPDEARRGAKFLGMTDVRILELTDRYLEAETQDMVDEIEDALRVTEPDLILTHSSNDVHQDHAAVHAAVLRAARNHHSIICFESPSVTNSFAPSIYIDVTDYSDVKNFAIAAHADQVSKPYMAREVVDGITSFRGRQARVKRAEAFEVVRLQLNQPIPL